MSFNDPHRSGATIDRLDARARDDVLAAVVAVETAGAPVPDRAFKALHDPALRAAVESSLAITGRCLVHHPGAGYLSAYDDAVAAKLIVNGDGVLSREDRAVLGLVLLRCVAIPGARGHIPAEAWLDGASTTLEELATNRHVTKAQLKVSLRRLEHADLIHRSPRGGIRPGPQFRRLTPASSTRLWEDLVLATRPDSDLARQIQVRRARQSTVQRAFGDDQAADDTRSLR